MAMKKSLPADRQGFTLVELVVVTLIFGVLLTVGVNVFFQVVMGANKASTEAELRQNASYVMEKISRSVRAGSCVGGYGSTTLFICDKCTTPCGNLNYKEKYEFTAVVQYTVAPGTPVTISSDKVDFGNSIVSNTPSDGKVVKVTLNVKQAGTPRWDYSGQITEEETIAVRNGIY